MRRLAVALLLLLLLLALLPAVPSAGAAVSGKRAKLWAAKIAALGQRPAGGPHEHKAQEIVKARLGAFGYSVTSQRFRLPNGDVDRNIVGRTTRPARVVIVAHVDGVYGTTGANDNGSGVGVLLDLARDLRNKPGVLLAATGAEERVVTGSSKHLGSLRLVRSLTPEQRSKVRVALALDMVGVGTRLYVRGIESSPNRSARVALARARALGIKVSYLQDSGQSDHAEMTRAGLPAAWVEWRNDVCWHSPCDEISRVKRWKLWTAGKMVRAAARAVLP